MTCNDKQFNKIYNFNQAIRIKTDSKVLISPILIIVGFLLCFLHAVEVKASPQAPTQLLVDSIREDVTTNRMIAVLAWTDNSEDETGFNIEHSLDGVNFSFFNSRGMDKVSFKVYIEHGQKVWFRVNSFIRTPTNQYIYSDYSNVISVVGVAPPTDLTATAISANEVQLMWLDSSIDEEGFVVERSLDQGETFSEIIRTTGFVCKNSRGDERTCYKDVGLLKDQNYVYRVASYRAIGLSYNYSNTVSMTPGIPLAPYFIAHTMMDKNLVIKLSLLDLSNNETGFVIERSIDDGPWSVLMQWNGNTTSGISRLEIFDRTIQLGRKYSYRGYTKGYGGDSEYVLKELILPKPPNNPTSTQWYINGELSGLDSDGSNWNKAWYSFETINWSVVKPGDTIYISGGVSGQVYKSKLAFGNSGIEGKPITVRVSSDQNHNGKVVIPGVSFDSFEWITLDGSKVQTNLPDVENIIENINIEVVNPYGRGVDSSNYGGNGIKIRFLEIHGSGVLHKYLDHGVAFTTQSMVKEQEIAYCHIHDNWQDGINVGGKQNYYGGIKIHHNIIEHNGDDGIQAAGGVDIYNNIIRSSQKGLGAGHPDGFQTLGEYFRIYNNLFYDFSNSWIFIELGAASSGHFQIYNNIGMVDKVVSPYGISINATTNNITPVVPSAIWEDILIANNVLVGLKGGTIRVYRTESQILDLRMKQVKIMNNIVYNNSDCVLDSAVIDVKGFNSLTTPADVIVDYNIVAGRCTKVRYAENLFSTPEQMAIASPFKNNSMQLPEFVNVNENNFHLRFSDTAARNKGFNLSGYFPTPPNLGFDKDGKERGNGAWDIGAFQASESKQVILGDVSDDGAVSIYDAALTARYFLGLINLTVAQINNADVSGDGQVSIDDASLIAQKSLGLISKFPVEL